MRRQAKELGMTSAADFTRKRPGRPAKFGRPSKVIAVTLPEDVIDRLRRVHRDLGWAIVNLVNGTRSGPSRREGEERDVELVTIAERRSLIVVNRRVIRHLPGVNIVPLSEDRAFLALDIDRGMSDLELAVSDRLRDVHLERRESRALMDLHAHLRAWRHDRALRIHTRAIIVVERPAKRAS
jgi:hypothetical protein